MAHVITVTNQKGGVGKTTTAVNLSACLAETGKRTLLVDLDPQGNATSGLGIDKTRLFGGIYDCLIDGRDINEIIVETAVKSCLSHRRRWIWPVRRWSSSVWIIGMPCCVTF